MRKIQSTRALFGALAVSALFAGGAFTAGNTVTAITGDTIGYGQVTVSGATVQSLAYNLNAAGDNVNSVTLVLDTNTTTSAVSVGFNGGAVTSCGTGTYNTTNTETSYTCTNGGSNFVQSTSGLSSTAVVVN